VEVIGEGLGCSVNYKVILNLIQEVTNTSIKSWNLNGQ
jgi:hypothetical protein